ncbi:carbohydrate ABC transporter permease [Hungatella hathewayi]|uniref:carbohydrate ABC transporter permease n=1 Tax=Hungatella hathewayi TaxID=154046 RepID=UPI0035682610
MEKKRIDVSKIVFTIVLFAIGITMLLPLIWMISTSLKAENEVFDFPINWIPKTFMGLENYKEVWGERYNFGMYYLNSIKITVISTFFQILVSAMGAYGFTKIKWKGRDTVFLAYLATMMIPPQVMIISRFAIMQKAGLYNTHMGMILMLIFSTYGVFLLRQAMMGIPDSLCESAKIDGASHITIFFKIVLPLITPSIATLAVLKFVWTWNDYQTPLVFLNNRSLFTIQLGMKMFATEMGSIYSLMMAAAVSAIVPLILVFILGQRYIIDGIASGAVKG